MHTFPHSIYLSIYLSIYPSIRPSIHLSIHPSVHPRRCSHTPSHRLGKRLPKRTANACGTVLARYVTATVSTASLHSILTLTLHACYIFHHPHHQAKKIAPKHCALPFLEADLLNADGRTEDAIAICDEVRAYRSHSTPTLTPSPLTPSPPPHQYSVSDWPNPETASPIS